MLLGVRVIQNMLESHTTCTSKTRETACLLELVCEQGLPLLHFAMLIFCQARYVAVAGVLAVFY